MLGREEDDLNLPPTMAATGSRYSTCFVKQEVCGLLRQIRRDGLRE